MPLLQGRAPPGRDASKGVSQLRYIRLPEMSIRTQVPARLRQIRSLEALISSEATRLLSLETPTSETEANLQRPGKRFYS